MFKLTPFRLGIVVLVVLAAIFVDSYSLIYRYLVVHQPLGTTLTSNPSVAGRPLYLHKGLDLQGGTELVIAVCKGPNDPPGAGCRQGPPAGKSVTDAQQASLPILQQRVNSLGVSEALVQAQGSDQILVQLPGVDLATAVKTVGTTAKLHFALPVQGSPNPSDPTFIGDQQNLYDPTQFNNPLFYPSGYHWKIDNNIDASDVTQAQVGTSQTNGELAVDITFNGHGADEWSKITTAAYSVYSSQGQVPAAQIAIFLDNSVITAPYVTGGGQSNMTEITGNFTSDSATTL
ncbi:MAG: hypothetical protein JOY80_01795, partial [Candidatus Dormibacteraeota bacterium]|nr:hypothetical protein [Candidatus Dormibacteraeota bacterium]